MTLDLDRLEAVARASGDCRYAFHSAHPDERTEFLNTFDPPTVLALIAEIRRMRDVAINCATVGFTQGFLAGKERDE